MSITKLIFQKIIPEAGQITFRAKVLWIFGILASLNFASNKIFTHFQADVKTMLFYFLPLSILFVVFRIFSLGGIISSVRKLSLKKTISFKSVFKDGKENFWVILRLNLIIFLFLFLSSIIIALIFVELNLLPVGLALLMLILIIATFLSTFGQIYCVTGKLNAIESIKNAWNFFLSNLWESILLGIFIALINICLSTILSELITQLYVNLILALAVFSLFTIFAQAAWILFFEYISKNKTDDKIKEKNEEEEKAKTPLTSPAISQLEK